MWNVKNMNMTFILNSQYVIGAIGVPQSKQYKWRNKRDHGS